MKSDALVVDVTEEWATACDVQQGFMQHFEPRIATLSHSERCRQMRALGGDCYDFVPLPHNRLGLVVGDASGKGLAAALMISSVQSSLRTAASYAGNDAPAVLDAVNRQVYASSLADRYATLFFGVFDEAGRTLEYVNAGHNPPLVIRGDGSLDWLETGGVPLGIFPNASYAQGAVQLDSGDLVIVYTDGVIEAANPAGEEWGIEGLCRVALESRRQRTDEIVDAIFVSVDEFSRECQADDATVVVVRMH